MAHHHRPAPLVDHGFGQAPTMISGPIPAGSPIVTAISGLGGFIFQQTRPRPCSSSKNRLSWASVFAMSPRKVYRNAEPAFNVSAACTRPEVHGCCRPVAFGHPDVLRRAARLWGASAEIVPVRSPDEIEPSPRVIPCIPCGPAEAADVGPGASTPAWGRRRTRPWCARPPGWRWPARSTRSRRRRCTRKRCTGRPQLSRAHRVAGGAVRGPRLRHDALPRARRRASPWFTSRCTRRCGTCSRSSPPRRCSPRPGWPTGSCRGHDGRRPRIGVCGLNPHGGEGGLFGDEERRVIAPARRPGGRAEGLCLEGPLPADTLMVRARDGEFDAVVAMYHDQGHIALKNCWDCTGR